ncbi:MAG TPA: methionyl-tRNA formyltransferase [Kineosporiaceae bacterium]
MRLVFAGTPQVALPALEAITASRHQLTAVVTRPAAPAGRGRRLSRSPVGEWADAAGVEVLTPRSPAEPDFLARLAELAPDCCPVVAYGALIPRAALAIPEHGWVNLHFSLLPAWRGAAPVQRALMAGDDVTGATTFGIEPALDSGPVYGVVTEEIRPADTAGDLLTRLSRSGAHLLVATLDGIEDGTLVAVPQPAEGVSLAPKVTVDDARVDWTRPAFAIDRLVRGCSPEPGAWTTLRGERVRLGPLSVTGPADPVPADPVPDGLAPGQLLVTKRVVLVGTGTAPVRLGRVQAQGKRELDAADWGRGLRLAECEAFG